MLHVGVAQGTVSTLKVTRTLPRYYYQLFLQLLERLKFYAGFEINDQLGSSLTDHEMTDIHYNKYICPTPVSCYTTGYCLCGASHVPYFSLPLPSCLPLASLPLSPLP